FKKIIMKPSFDVDLAYLNISYQSAYGTIKSFWKKENGQLTWKITIPPNSVAIIYVPAKSETEVKEGNKPASGSEAVQLLRMENGKAIFEIGSGNFSFTSLDQLN